MRQLSSPGSADRSELMLCVATIGISRACRDSANVRSSPVGSVSPTVANAWYSSQTNSRSRHTRVGIAPRSAGSAAGRRAGSRASASRPGRAPGRGSCPTGKFSASTRPVSSRSSSGGSGSRCAGRRLAEVGAARRAERAVDGRVVVEQRQEHDDALGDGGAEARDRACSSRARTSARRRRADAVRSAHAAALRPLHHVRHAAVARGTSSRSAWYGCAM